MAECKSCEKRTKRQLQKDIGDFVANQKPIANTLRRALGSEFKQKIIWFFVTKNIEWSEPDLARAEEANIKVITEKDLFYYKEIAKRIGKAARFQFHAEFLANTKVHALERKVFAMRTKLAPIPGSAVSWLSNPLSRHQLRNVRGQAYVAARHRISVSGAPSKRVRSSKICY